MSAGFSFQKSHIVGDLSAMFLHDPAPDQVTAYERIAEYIAEKIGKAHEHGVQTGRDLSVCWLCNGTRLYQGLPCPECTGKKRPHGYFISWGHWIRATESMQYNNDVTLDTPWAFICKQADVYKTNYALHRSNFHIISVTPLTESEYEQAFDELYKRDL